MKQEAPLTLRGQRGRCTNIKGEPQNFRELPLPRATSTFSSVWDFMMGLSKPQSHARKDFLIITVLYKTKSLDGTKPNTNSKTNPQLTLTVILTLFNFSCFMFFSSTVP